MERIVLFLVTTCLAMASSVYAHSLWINSFESQNRPAHHAVVSLGWGHALPMDEILTSSQGRIDIQSFDLIAPDQQKMKLIKPPPFKPTGPVLSTKNVDLFAADLAVQKIAIKEGGANGAYQLSAVSVPSFFTQYVDKKGRMRMEPKPKNEVRDIGNVLMSVRFQAFAKAYLTMGKWTDPKPLEHGLEIIPHRDLSNLQVGDMVEVEVLFYGRPLTSTAKSIEYITAHSSSFGQNDGFCLYSPIMNSKARFRVQSAGQWMISVNHKEDVTSDGPLKDLHGKAERVYQSASLTFSAR
jgi:uncharacterized GH25 family protein